VTESSSSNITLQTTLTKALLHEQVFYESQITLSTGQDR